MTHSPKVLGIVLAGGEGKRLMPLTADRAKPAVPFGGNYRLIDFVLSNIANAGFRRICVLTQYKSHSLDRHISTAWRQASMFGDYITPVPAQQRLGPRWYTGSADAILQSLNLIYDEQPDYVLVFPWHFKNEFVGREDKYLKNGGHYCLNIPKELYVNVAIKVLGKANTRLILPKSKRNNDEKYEEFIYIWQK